MPTISYYNLKVEESRDGSLSEPRIVLHFYLIFVVINLIQSVCFMRVCMKAKQFAKNWNFILSFLLLIHTFHCIAIIAQRLVNIYHEPWFIYLSHIRLYFLAIEFFTIPILTIERYLSFAYLETYDNKRCIPQTLVLFLILIAGVFTTTFHMVTYSYIHLGAVILINIVAVLADNCIMRLNKRLLLAINKPHAHYSLSQRYQIITNIRMYKMVKKTVIVFATCNCCLAAYLIMDNLDLPITLKNISALVFDFCVLVASFILIKVISKSSPMWRQVVRKAMQQIFQSYSTSSKVTMEKPATITGSFGRELQTSYGDPLEHFYNLQKHWEESVA